MDRLSYEKIRELLYRYSDWELELRNHYLKYHDFMRLDKATPGESKQQRKDLIKAAYKAAISSSGIADNGIMDISFDIATTNFLQGDSLINASYDLGIIRHPRYYKVAKHSHDFYELEYMLEGSSSHTIWVDSEKRQLTLKEGGFILLPPNLSHEVSVNDESVLINILIRKEACESALLQNIPVGSELTTFIRGILHSESPSYLILQTDNALELQYCLFDLLIENYGNGFYRRELANLKTSILFLNILSRTGLSIEHYSKNMKNSEYIPAIISYMEQNYRTITPNKIAEAFGYSRAHLGRMYKQYTGNTLQESINNIRMRKAAELLRETNTNVENIGRMIGYDDVTGFIRHFRRFSAQTPHQYRNDYR